MKLFENKSMGVLLTALLMFCFLNIFYSKIIYTPNKYLFSDIGDGIKNYYGYVYHIKYDSSYINSMSMNYPYGENVLFIDIQPAVSNTIKLISEVFPGIIDYSIGVINWLMIMSFVLCAVFLYLILLELKLPTLYSALAAISISVLSPQILRLYGHYSMAYFFYLPLTIYLFFLFFRSNNKIVYSVLIFFTALIFIFVHVYVGISIILLGIGTWFWYLASNRIELKNYRNYLYLVLQLVLPIIVFQFYVWATDTRTDRTPTPWGLNVFVANPQSVFLPAQGPVLNFLNYFFEVKGQLKEVWAYIGFTTNLILLIVAAGLVDKLKIKYMPENFSKFMIAAIAVLIFSMGIPFIFDIEIINKILQPLMQFRALGRFAWVFYYVITIYAVFIIYQLFEKIWNSNTKVFAVLFLIFTHGMYITESVQLHTEASKSITRINNFFDTKSVPGEMMQILEKIDDNKYQAIIPLPFFHYGSEYFDTMQNDTTMKLAQIISYHKKLPMCAALLARTSISENKNIIQLFSPNIIDKPIFKDFKNKKPFLITCTKNELSDAEKYLLNKAVKIAETSNSAFYELSYESLTSSDAPFFMAKFEKELPDLNEKAGFMVSDTSKYLYFDDFDTKKSKLLFQGNGSYQGLKKDFSLLTQISANQLDTNEYYTASIWYYNKGFKQNHINFISEEKDWSTGKTNWDYYITPVFPVMIDGDWSLVELKFKVKDSKNTVNILLNGEDKEGTLIYADNILIRKSNVDVFKVLKTENNKPKQLFYNNLIINY